MDRGVLQMLEDDEDENAAAVSGADVEAFTASLNGDIRGMSSGGGRINTAEHESSSNATIMQTFLPAQSSGGMAHNMQSNPPPQPSTSSVSNLQTQAQISASPIQSTGVAMQGVSGETSTATATQQRTPQWQQFMPQQQEMLQERRQQHQQQLTQQQADSGQNASSVKRAGGPSQAISFGTLMPMLLPTLQPEQRDKLLGLYQKLRRSEISKEDFLRTTRLLVGDQVLVQTVKQMQLKQQQQQHQHQQLQVQVQRQGAQAELQQQHSFPQHTVQQQSKQASELQQSQQPPFRVQESHEHSEIAKSNRQDIVQAHSPQQPQQQLQPNIESTLQYQTTSMQPRVSHLSTLQMHHQQNRPGEQWHERQVQQMNQPTSGSLNLQQVKSEVDKTMASMHLARQQPPLTQQHVPQVPFSSPQLHPSTGTYQMQNIVAASPGQSNSQSPTQQQVPGQALGQVQQSQHGGQTQLFDTASQQSALKPLSKYAKQKLRKEQKKREDEERMKRIQDEEKMRRLQSGGILSVSGQQGVHCQVAEQNQNQSVQTTTPQNTLPIKQEPLEMKNDKVSESQIQLPLARQEFHSGEPSQRLESVFQPSDVSLLSTTSSKDFSAQNLDAAQNRVDVSLGEASATFKSTIHNPPQQANMSSGGAPGIPLAQSNNSGQGFQSTISLKQVGKSLTGYIGGVASSTNITAQTNPPSLLTTSVNTVPAPVSVSGNLPQLPAISAAAQVRTPPKKPLSEQRKPAEVTPSMQARSKKQKVAGDVSDQSIDQLNDVTAVSGVNLREEEEQLLAGPKEESRTTQAMRRFAQEEEGRLFLQKGPLRTKVTAIAAKQGVGSVSEDVEQCLSMSTEERLRSMLYKLIKLSSQRCEEEKERHRIVVTSDLQRHISLIRKRAKEAQEKKQAVESERLRKLNEEKEKGVQIEGAKEDSRKEKKGQKDEEEKQRANAANVAARAAAGVNDLLIKWQMMAEQGRQKREGDAGTSDGAADGNTGTPIGSISGREVDMKHGSGDAGMGGRTNVEGPTSGASSRKASGGGPAAGRGPAQRSVLTTQPAKAARTITVRDVIAFLETEPQMAKSTLLYRLYDKSQSSCQAISAGGNNLASLSN